MTHLRGPATVIVLAILSNGFAARLAVADHLLQPKTGTISLPLPGGKALGFTAKVEMGDSGAPGYVAMQIDVKSIGTFAADRRLTFVLESMPGGYSPPANGLRYEIPVNVSQGDKSKRVVRYIPKWSVGDAYLLHVLEDNRRLEDYQIDFGSPLRLRRGPPSEPVNVQNQLQWLFIQDVDHADASILPNINGLMLASVDPSLVAEALQDPAALADSALIGQSMESQLIGWRRYVNVTGRLELPTDWRGYLRHDVVVISERTIEFLRNSAPQRWQTLRDWVLNGGTVVAYDAASDRSTADLLDFAVPQVRDNRVVASIATEVKMELSDPRNFELSSDAAAIAGLQRYEPSQWADHISSLPAGSGLVIGLQDDSASDFPVLLYWRIVVELVSFRRSPMVRRGVDPLIGDGRFHRWLIPGVAQPPVYTFMALLTCFVVLVGPIAYRRTTRYGRGYLMFAIAPILAIATTLAMFGYGIVADGFGTMARVRQLTWVDGGSGDAGERVRATYFAGVRPATGLTFPANAEVYMYPENIGVSWEELNKLSWSTLGTVRITDQVQVFDNAFLPSRQQRQFVLEQPRRQIGRLVLTPASSSQSSPLQMVRSTFDFALRDLVIRDQAGRYWTAPRVLPGADTPCESLTLKDASKALGGLYNRYRPISEVREARQRNLYRNDTRDLIAASNRELFQATRLMTDGGFEQWLQESLQTNGEIPRSMFVALADVSQDMIAVPGTELIESVRYVFGTLP